MIFHRIRSTFTCIARQGTRKQLPFVLCALFLATANSALAASFTIFNGGSTAESNWQTAAGTSVLENFESFSVGAQIASLPALGIGFDTLAGGGLPQIYLHFTDVTGYGKQQLGNFPNGINSINRFDDIVLHVLPSYQITSLGFWNGDGQADTFWASAYDASNNLLGKVGAFQGTFAGFISSVAISRVVFDGQTGDGWNHLDGLQTNPVAVNPVPEPSTILLLGTGLLGMVLYRRKQGLKQV